MCFFCCHLCNKKVVNEITISVLQRSKCCNLQSYFFLVYLISSCNALWPDAMARGYIYMNEMSRFYFIQYKRWCWWFRICITASSQHPIGGQRLPFWRIYHCSRNYDYPYTRLLRSRFKCAISLIYISTFPCA